MNKEFVEHYLIIKIKDIDYVKVLFEDSFPSGWTTIVTQNRIIEMLKLLFEDFEVELHSRFKELNNQENKNEEGKNERI